jgi:3-oxoadipate enol-lactonase/4-carboxymuconolactone decarboxylase
VCGALAAFDVRDRLAEIKTPVLAVAGSADAVTPPSGLEAIATGVADGRLVVLDGVGHLAPAEAPDVVARLIGEHVRGGPERDAMTVSQVRDAGMAVRREVLGDAHVDRATASATDLTAEFQQFITEYAWGGIWTRPGLDRRSRSLVTLTALVARGHHEELAMHLRAARTNGVSVEEIKELLMQAAIYCGVPDANTAFRIAQQVLEEG